MLQSFQKKGSGRGFRSDGYTFARRKFCLAVFWQRQSTSSASLDGVR